MTFTIARKFLCFLFLVLLISSLGRPQVSTSNITGSVQDTSGAVVINAKVVASNEQTGVKYETATTSKGDYTLSSLPPGTYTVNISKDGFNRLTSTHNTLEVGVPLVVNGTLKVGATNQVIEVESSGERLETTSAQLSDIVRLQEVKQLPLNGRNPLNLITLEPGLIQRNSSAGSGSGTHAFGGRNGANNVTIDGIEANENTNPDAQSNLYRLNPDNVAEYRVITHNATPEYGRNSGAQVAIATKSGTNSIHGDLFYFHRNDAFNANEWFNKYEQIQKGQPQHPPVLRLHQWGTDVGGPIVKDRTFWFFSYQSNHIALTQPIAVAYGGTPLVYTTAARAGLFRYFIPDPSNPLVISGKTINGNSPSLVDPNTGQLLPQVPVCSTPGQLRCVQTFNIGAQDVTRGGAGLDPTVQGLLGRLPAANSFGVGDGLNTAGFVWNPPSGFRGPAYMIRIDHKFSDRDNVFGRVNWSNYDTKQGDFLNNRPAVYPGFPPEGLVTRASQNVAVSYRHVFTTNIVNEFTGGIARFNFTFPIGENFKGSTFPSWLQDCGFGPNTFVNINTGACNNPRTHRASIVYQYIDNLSFVHGAHTYRTGINFRFYQHNDARGAPGGGNITPTIVFDQTVNSSGFATPAGMVANSPDITRFQQSAVELLGIPARVSTYFPADVQHDLYGDDLQRLHTRVHQFDFYGQDEWKIRTRLTMTYGLRWEYNPPAFDAQGGTFVSDKPIDGSQGIITFVKTDGWWKRSNRNAFAPRVGVAWSPFGNDKTVVRAGYGIAFDTVNTFMVTAEGGKVPGAVLQLRPIVSGRLGSVVSNLSTLAGTPTVKPSSQFSPPIAAFGTAPDTGAFDPNLKLPTVHEWSLTIQRELPAEFVVQVGYVGKHGTHLFRGYDLNQIRADQPGFLQSFLIAQNNLKLGCKADGTGCPAGVTGVPPVLLEQLSGCTAGLTCSFLNGSTIGQNFQQNGLGEVARRVDTNFKYIAAGFPASYFRPNPQFSQIFFQDARGTSTYHGFIAQLRRRYQQGLEFGLAYTWSKSIDDMSFDPVGASTGGGLTSTNSRTPTDVRNFRLDRAVSDFDNAQVVVAHLVYELPFGKGRRFASSPANRLR